MTLTRLTSATLCVAFAFGEPCARAQDEHTVVDDGTEPAAPAAEPHGVAPPSPEGPPSNVHFELLTRGGYMSPAIHGGITPFGFGAGGGAGLAIGHVYIGGSIVAYAGGSDATGSSEHSILYGVETGYELQLPSAFTLRPFVGVGGATITHSIPLASSPSNGPVSVAVKPPDVITQATGGGGGGGSSATTSDTVVNTLYLESGLLAMFASKSGLFIGLRASVLYFPNVSYGADASAKWLPYALHLTLGDRF